MTPPTLLHPPILEPGIFAGGGLARGIPRTIAPRRERPSPDARPGAGQRDDFDLRLGYAVAHYAEFYELDHVLLTGGVTSGEGGRMIVDKARRVLEDEFPALASRTCLHLAAEKEKSHGQAVAAATLPELSAKP